MTTVYSLKSVIAVITVSLIGGLSIGWILGTPGSKISIPPAPSQKDYGEILNNRLKKLDVEETEFKAIGFKRYSGEYLRLPSKYNMIDPSNSGSMFPCIQDHHTIVEVPISNLTQIQVGDIITYRTKDKLITHRAYQINQTANCVVTLGDNNRDIDGCIPIENVTGKATMIITGETK